MKNNLNVLVIKDEDDGKLYPMTGIWIDNQAGEYGAEDFLFKNKGKGLIVVKAELTEKL